MNANAQEAQECAYQAFSDVFERIRAGKINESKYIFSYLITTSRHQYLHFKKHSTNLIWILMKEFTRLNQLTR